MVDGGPHDDVRGGLVDLARGNAWDATKGDVIPMQDALVLDGPASMNDPASFLTNRGWCLPRTTPATNAQRPSGAYATKTDPPAR